MRIEILQRLVMAKLLFKQGESLCNKRNDRFAFAMGLLALQDAVEMVLGVVAEHVQAKVSDKTRFPEYFNLIEEKDNDTPIRKWRTQLLKLNKIRVISNMWEYCQIWDQTHIFLR